MNRRIGRTILAIVVALAVATLPAAIGFAASATTATEIFAAETMPDCDHHHYHHHNNAPSGKTHKAADDGACMAGCALTCFSFTATGFSGVTFSSPASAALKLVRTSTNVSSCMGSPPFRPPRT